MISYKYKCPIDRMNTTTLRAMCTHMVRINDHPPKHAEWIELHGINYYKLRGPKNGKTERGCYKPLMEVVERECKIQELKRS